MSKLIYYSQWDAKWGDIPYTIDGDTATETIGKSGCGPTCMAMILATWVDKNITPEQTCKMAIAMKDRTADNGTEWEFFGHIAAKYDLKYNQTESTDEAVAALKAGAYVICSMGPGYFTKRGHFILAYKADEKTIYVNDPNNSSKTSAAISLFRQQCIQYFVFYKTADLKTEVKTEVNTAKASEIKVNAIKVNTAKVVTVKDVQMALISLKYNVGAADGIIGPKTIAAIKKFQSDNKLVVDGIAGDKTKAKLKELINKK